MNIIDPFAAAAATATSDGDDDTQDIITIIDTQDRSKRLTVRLGDVLQAVDRILGRVGTIVE
jgi:hypothetical protein